MMPSLQEIVGILIATLGGLAVGLEREWSGHATGPQARFAGVRTLTLLGILSGTSGWLWTRHFETLAAILIAAAGGLVVAAYVAASRRDVEGTTEVAALVVIAAGLASGVGAWELAGGVIAVTTLLLVEKSKIHDLARRLDDTSLRAAVRFGVMAVVVLPLLPEGPFGPGAGFRPRTLWLAVLIFSGLSFSGYLARKGLRGKSGYPVAGLLGGLMSSTGVTFSFSRLSRSEGQDAAGLAVGVIGACTVLFLRVLAATATLNAALAIAVAPYFALPFLVGLAGVAVVWRLNGKKTMDEPPIRNPLQFWNSIEMAVLFQIVLYMVHWLRGRFGDQGFLVSGAVLGFADMDALTISMAKGTSGMDTNFAAQALAVGVLSNTVLKTAAALIIGKGRFRWLTAVGLVVVGAAIVASLLLLR